MATWFFSATAAEAGEREDLSPPEHAMCLVRTTVIHADTTRMLLAVLLGLTAALANVAGGLLIARRQWSGRYLKYFIALGAGFMLATALLEMIPASVDLRSHASSLFFGRTNAVFMIVLAGYFTVHFFEHTIAPHFHFGEETHHEEMSAAGAGYTALLGLVIHTFFDGVAMASGFLVSSWLGVVIFVAIFLHKFPEGFTVASLMLASGRSRRVALLSSVLLGVATLAGVALMFAVKGAVADALPFAAGVTLYVAASDLIPEVNREPGIAMALLVFLGVAVMLGLQSLFQM